MPYEGVPEEDKRGDLKPTQALSAGPDVDSTNTRLAAKLCLFGAGGGI